MNKKASAKRPKALFPSSALPVSAEFRIRLLGGFGLEARDAELRAIETPRLQALLAYLVLHREEWQPRERLAFQFWPGSEESQARTNLRQALHHLRRSLPDHERILESEGRTVCWRADAPVALDVAEFEKLLACAQGAREANDGAAERSALQDAISLYRGDLFPDCYDDWIVPEREAFRESYLRAIERLCELSEVDRDYRGAVSWARRLLDEDPLNEKSCRRLMRLHALGGDRAEALRVYHAFARSLVRDVGVEPDVETRRVYEGLLETLHVQSRVRRSRSVPGRQSCLSNGGAYAPPGAGPRRGRGCRW